MEEKKIVNFFQIFPRFWNFRALFSKRAHWNLLIFAPHVVQTLPEPAMRSDLMHIFAKGYLGKKYGVYTYCAWKKEEFDSYS